MTGAGTPEHLVQGGRGNFDAGGGTLAPVRAGDCVEAEARLVRVGRRSREVTFTLRVVARSTPERGVSTAAVLDPPIVATTATGVVVVP